MCVLVFLVDKLVMCTLQYLSENLFFFSVAVLRKCLLLRTDGRAVVYGIRAPSCSPFVQQHSFCFLRSVTAPNLFTDTRTCCNANRFLVQSRLSSSDRGNKRISVNDRFLYMLHILYKYIINVTGLPQCHNKLRVRGRCFCFDLFLPTSSFSMHCSDL